jgi:hypothetical protein
MKTFVFISLVFALTSCTGDDTRTWESDTNGPPAQMRCPYPHQKQVDENTWPPDNRTGNKAYHLRKEEELRAQLKTKPNQSQTKQNP